MCQGCLEATAHSDIASYSYHSRRLLIVRSKKYLSLLSHYDVMASHDVMLGRHGYDAMTSHHGDDKPMGGHSKIHRVLIVLHGTALTVYSSNAVL